MRKQESNSHLVSAALSTYHSLVCRIIESLTLDLSALPLCYSAVPCVCLFHHSGIIIDGTSVSPICTLSLRLYGFVSTWHRLPSTAIINCVLFYIVPLLEIHGSSCSTPMISRLWLSRLCGTSPSLPLCGSHIQPPRHRLLPDR